MTIKVRDLSGDRTDIRRNERPERKGHKFVRLKRIFALAFRKCKYMIMEVMTILMERRYHAYTYSFSGKF